jgi:dihydroorotate dehydrogenase
VGELKMDISELYSAIHKRLREDSVIINLLGLTNPSMVDLVTRIQKRMNPSSLLTLPMICFYNHIGTRGIENHLEYTAVFDFDIYTKDDVETALNITNRINELFNNKYIKLENTSSFRSYFVTCSEVNSDEPNIYKFYTQVAFTITIKE